MSRTTLPSGRALLAILLLLAALALPACAGRGSTDENGAPPEALGAAESEGGSNAGGQTEDIEGGKTVGGTTIEALRPEDVLSEEERAEIEVPKAEDWYRDSGAEPIQIEGGGSAGAIPAVKPFNFGRDPGGPADKTMYLSVPKLGLVDVPVFDSVEEEKLREGTIHVPATGFPWQEGANTYIAGHRIGYPGTPSDRVFYDLPELAPGDEITLRDSAGAEYVYGVTEEERVVPPDNVEVMNAVPGRSIVSLQTCTLPDYSKRIVVQGELI